MTWQFEFEVLGRMLIACLCGALIGYERKNRKKEAGIRTHIIVAMGSAMMMVISKYAYFDLLGANNHWGAEFKLDPSRVASGIVTGVGFLGAGMIFYNKKVITGLTTAAGIWATAGVGMAIGSGLYFIGVSGAVIILFVQIVFHKNFKFLNSSVQETICIIVNDVTLATDVMKSYFDSCGLVVEDISLIKLPQKKAEIEIAVSGDGINKNDLLSVIKDCDGIESVHII